MCTLMNFVQMFLFCPRSHVFQCLAPSDRLHCYKFARYEVNSEEGRESCVHVAAGEGNLTFKAQNTLTNTFDIEFIHREHLLLLQIKIFKLL